VAASKDIDPRFDAAFQRGGHPAYPDVHVAARNVDALREASSPAAPAPASRPKQPSPITVGVENSAGPAADAGRSVAGDHQEDVAPQSHYVDDSGALTD
jgi:hypothetical protein